MLLPGSVQRGLRNPRFARGEAKLASVGARKPCGPDGRRITGEGVRSAPRLRWVAQGFGGVAHDPPESAPPKRRWWGMLGRQSAPDGLDLTPPETDTRTMNSAVAATGAVEITAPAKLTLSLRITGVRADGYHLVDAVMTCLDLADELTIKPLRSAPGRTPRSEVTTTDPHGRRILRELPAEHNLVTKALSLAGEAAEVAVRKHIPAGAGLGGGSSDAAAVLRWAGFGPGDERRAASIGADVAFCLIGGRARVRGIGEIIEPLGYVQETYTLQLAPPACSTPVVYAAWDDLGGPTGAAGNDLEPAALAAYPELARSRDALGDATGVTPRLAGSGGTWFVPGAFPGPHRLVCATTAAAR